MGGDGRGDGGFGSHQSDMTSSGKKMAWPHNARRHCYNTRADRPMRMRMDSYELDDKRTCRVGVRVGGFMGRVSIP